VAVFKEFNIRRHYETRHGGQYASLLGQLRRDKVARLKSGFAAQQSTMLRQTKINLSSVRASFKVAQLIASCGKSFSDGEFVKKGLNAVAEEVCPDRK
jgi:phosphate/sulfate permease